MEKISIVRRRLEISPTRAEMRARQRMQQTEEEPAGSVALMDEERGDGGRDDEGHGDVGGDGSGVNVDLGPDVMEGLWSGGHLEETATGKRHFIVEAEKDKEDGHVVLKLQFMKPDYYLRLLTCEEVCEMLHISRSTVYGYARRGVLKSYRMGRGLRFRFQDVLDFLTGCEAGTEQEG